MTSSVWLEEQLTRALDRVDALTREMGRLQAGAQLRDQEIDALRLALTTIDGRTQRHEADQDAVRWLQHALAALDQRLTEETTLRREQAAQGERGQEHVHLTEQEIAHALQSVAERVEGAERALAGVQQHEARLGSDLGALLARESQVHGYIESLAVQVEASTAAAKREVSSVALVEEAVAATQLAMRSLEARTLGLQGRQQYVEGEMVALRRLDEYERQLTDLTSHHRLLGARLEEGLTLLRESVAALHGVQEGEAQERALLRARLGTLEQRLAAVDAAVAGQREVLVEHFQRTTAAAAEAGRRESEEIERQARARRELMVRLAERADETAREQPL